MTNDKNWILELYSWIYTVLILLGVFQVFPSALYYMIAVTGAGVIELILKKLIKKTLDKEDWKRAAIGYIIITLFYIVYIFVMIQKYSTAITVI